MVAENRKTSACISHKKNKKPVTKADEDVPSKDRRGLIKAGLISAPIILTLKGQSALGAHDQPNPKLSKFSLGKSKPHRK